MSSATQTLPNYRLPEKCCFNCQHSYLNEWEDKMCDRRSGADVDAGGICDGYEPAVK